MRLLKVSILMLAVLSLPACNTVQGVGKDIQKAGGAIEKSGK